MTAYSHGCGTQVIFRSSISYYKILQVVVKERLQVKLPTISTDGRAEVGRVREEKRREEERRSEKREDQRRERVRRKKMQVREKVIFPMIGGSGWSKSRLAKAAAAEPAGQMRDEELHAVVTRSILRSQNAQNAPMSGRFWMLRCRKSARRCGAKHISKSKCTKHTSLRPLLEVEMSKKCPLLWRETHFQVKMCKAHHSRTTFGSCHVEKLHYTPPHCTALDYTTTTTSTTTTPHYTTLHFTPIHSTTLHSITLHHTTLHYTNYNHSYNYNWATLHYATLDYTTLQQLQLQLQLRYFTLHYTTLHYITLITPPQMQLQLHYTNCTTPQLQLHYTTTATTAALHHTTSSSCGWGDRPVTRWPLQPL